MKKKFFIFIFIFLMIFIILISTYIIYNKKNNDKLKKYQNNEYQPEEEFPETGNYDTSISLYLIDPTSGILTDKNIVLDARKLIDNPYKYIINLLINPPDNLKMQSAIAKGTKVNNCVMDKGVLTVDFSSEFLNSTGTNSVYSIVNTLSQFNEVDGVIIKINGEENNQLKEKFLKVI